MGFEAHLTYRFPLDRQQERFRELILYVSKRCEDAIYFGAVKLNKILFWSDMWAFRRLGRPVTGAEYRRFQKGPAPTLLPVVRREMQIEGILDIERRKMFDYEQERTVARREPDTSLFSVEELRIVDEIISQFWNENAEEVSDLSHDVIWLTRENKDPIPYEAAYLDPSPLTKEEIDRTYELARRFSWR
jgi:hypothetical protein